jgi:hypothetical protein
MPAESGLGGLKRQLSMVRIRMGSPLAAGEAALVGSLASLDDLLRATSSGVSTTAVSTDGAGCSVHSVAWGGRRPSRARYRLVLPGASVPARREHHGAEPPLALGKRADALDVAAAVELEDLPRLRAEDVEMTGLGVEGEPAQLDPVAGQGELRDVASLRRGAIAAILAGPDRDDPRAVEDVEAPRLRVDAHPLRVREAEIGQVEALGIPRSGQHRELVRGRIEQEHPAPGVLGEVDGIRHVHRSEHVAVGIPRSQQLQLSRVP